MSTFGSRLRAAIDAHSRLCVGIDPHESLLEQWGLPVSASGAREFGMRAVEAAAGRVGIVKPQISFFERFGSEGFAALEDVLTAARAAGLLVIADVKRGDIGTTMDAYAAAWLTPGAPLEADAITVSPYLGFGSLASTLDYAAAHGKGVFVLAATSNPEATEVQAARSSGGGTVAAAIAEQVERLAVSRPDDVFADVGLVIGATVDLAALGLERPFARALPILAPGFGAQGAQPSDLAGVFGPHAADVVASESRSVLSAGPAQLAERIAQRAAQYREGTHV